MPNLTVGGAVTAESRTRGAKRDHASDRAASGFVLALLIKRFARPCWRAVLRGLGFRKRPFALWSRNCLYWAVHDVAAKGCFLSRMSQAVWDWLIPDALRAEPEKLRQANRVLAFCCAMAVWVPVFSGIYSALGATTCSLIVAMAGVFLVLVPVMQRISCSPIAAGNSLVLLAFLVYSGIAAYSGGHRAPSLTWYVTLPVMAVLLVDVGSGVFWAMAAAMALTAFHLMHHAGYRLPQELSREGLDFVRYSALMGLIGCVLLLTLVFKTFEMKAQRALEAALRSAEAADRAKGEFLANMSHEIRTPMTAILGYADLLLTEASRAIKPLEPAALLSHLQTIQRNGAHLLQVINDILDLSKIEAGKLEVERIPCSPRQAVAEVVTLLRGRAEAKELDFREEYAGELPDAVLSDPTRLRQILLNLVGNALKFTEKGSVRVVARFPAAADDGCLQFEVIDTGIGMSEEQIRRAFVPFSQADYSTTRRFGGTGLGLAISKRLAEMLGGTIAIESRLGEGCTVRVRLPVECCRDEDPASQGETSESVVEQDAAARLECRILLAEDGPDNQRLLAHVLGRAGAEVTVVANGQEALERALKEQERGAPFDVILMDMQMPVLGGCEATRRLREQGYERPIIALTAFALPEEQGACLAAGCDDCAAKPIDRAALFAAIERQLNQRPLGGARQSAAS